MPLSREAIVEGLQRIVGPEDVITDEPSSGRAASTTSASWRTSSASTRSRCRPPSSWRAAPQQVAEILRFADEHGVNVIPRTGATATEGGLESAVADSVIIDGSAHERDPRASTPTTCRPRLSAACRCRPSRTASESSASPPGTRRSRSRWPTWAASWPRAASASSRPCTAASRTWSWASRPSSPAVEVTRIKNVPRRAAGPDIRHVVIGNEGALCFITEVTVKLFPYFPENNVFLGWTLKDMKTGFEALREVMVERLQAVGGAGLRPRRRRPALLPLRRRGRLRAALHGRGPGRHRHGDGRGHRGDRRAASRSARPVDSAYIETWFNDLCWGPEQDHRRGRAHPPDAQREPHHRDLRRLELDQRHLPGGAGAHHRRDPRHHDDGRALLAQLHQRHQHVLQLLLQRRRRRAGGGDRQVLPPHHQHHLRGDAAGAAARSSTITAWARRGRRGSRTSTAHRTTSSRR